MSRLTWEDLAYPQVARVTGLDSLSSDRGFETRHLHHRLKVLMRSGAWRPSAHRLRPTRCSPAT